MTMSLPALLVSYISVVVVVVIVVVVVVVFLLTLWAGQKIMWQN